MSPVIGGVVIFFDNIQPGQFGTIFRPIGCLVKFGGARERVGPPNLDFPEI